MAAPKLGLDETMELFSRVLVAGDEDPDLSALSAALKLGRSWRDKQPPSKRTSANCALPWRLTASAPSKISGAATPLTSPSGGKPCGGP